jgi:transposase-like protein
LEGKNLGKNGSHLTYSKKNTGTTYGSPDQKNGKYRRSDGADNFTPGEALADFSARFLDADACRSWILARLHPAGPACPHCRQPLADDRRIGRWNAGQRIQCANCSRFFTSTTRTLLAGKHGDPATVFLLAVLIGLDVRNDQAARVIGCDPETIRLWRQRFEAIEFS